MCCGALLQNFHFEFDFKSLRDRFGHVGCLLQRREDWLEES
jgi:hypothetical protein